MTRQKTRRETHINRILRSAEKTIERIVKQLTGTQFRRGIAGLTLSAFLLLTGACYILARCPTEKWFNTGMGQILVGILTNLWAASVLSMIGIVLWFIHLKYREQEVTIHVFNYAADGQVGHKRKRLALEIREGIADIVAGASYSCRAIEGEDARSLRLGTTEELTDHDTGHIVVVPFAEIARTLCEVFSAPSTVPDEAWAERCPVELMRTYAFFVTYDPRLEARVGNVRNLRLFSTPLIDVPAMFNDILDSGATHVVLLNEREGEFLEVERALQGFVNGKVQRLRRAQEFMGKGIPEVVECEQYKPQEGQKVCLFALSVDPSEEILKRVATLSKEIAKAGCTVIDTYVPPTWIRNWLVNTHNQRLLGSWKKWLGGIKLKTALPEGVAVNRELWRDTVNSFDIIVFYTREALALANEVRNTVVEGGGTRYDKTAEVLEAEVNKLLRAWNARPDSCFLATFEHGDVFYEPVIVRFFPNPEETNFRVELGTCERHDYSKHKPARDVPSEEKDCAATEHGNAPGTAPSEPDDTLPF